MDPRHHLYTRQQIQALTGADESTLNFWARENIIRPASGGGGKGQHRRYGFEQVNLAAILLRFKKFGVSIQSLREISTIFHNALSYTRGLDLTAGENSALSMMIYYRRTFLRDGFVKFSVDVASKEGEHARRQDRHASPSRLSWTEFLDHARELEDGASYTKRLAELVERADLDELSWNSFVAGIVTIIAAKRYEGSEADYYYLDEHGSWSVAADISGGGTAVDSFIAVDATRISYETWVLNAAKLQLGAAL